MNSIFNLEDQKEQERVEKILGQANDSSNLGTAQYCGSVTFQVSQNTSLDGTVSIFPNALLFTAPTKTFVLALTWKRLEPFQVCEQSGKISSLGFTIYGSTNSYEFSVQSEDELEEWLDILYQKVIILSPLEDYTDLRKFAGGNFGNIYRGRCIEDGQTYAIKQVSKCVIASSEQSKVAIVNEIDTLRSISHPCVIKLHRVYEDEDCVYLVTDLALYGDLHAHIIKVKLMSQETAAKILHSLLTAVSFLHNNGIIHRDIKPENILLHSATDASQLVLADFGLACNFLKSPETFEQRCGSPGYVAPEVFNGAYGCTADIYSLGVILYIMLSGLHPFGNQADQLLRKNRKAQIYFNAEQWSNMSRDALDLVTRMLDSDPVTRISINDALVHPWIAQHLGSQVITANSLQLTQAQAPVTHVVRNDKRKMSQGLVHRMVNKEEPQQGMSHQETVKVAKIEAGNVRSLLKEAI